MVFNLYRKSGNLYRNTYTLNSNIYRNSYKFVRKLYNMDVFPYKQNDTCVVARSGVKSLGMFACKFPQKRCLPLLYTKYESNCKGIQIYCQYVACSSSQSDKATLDYILVEILFIDLSILMELLLRTSEHLFLSARQTISVQTAQTYFHHLD